MDLTLHQFMASTETQHTKRNRQHGKNVSNCVDPISCRPALSEPLGGRTPCGC